MWAHGASCYPADVVRVEQEIQKKASNVGIGVLDLRNGAVRVLPYDETDSFSRANPALQVMAGHEAAAAMVGIPQGDARGFVLSKKGSAWHLHNLSHLNRADGQANSLRMDPQSFTLIATALQSAGISQPVLH